MLYVVKIPLLSSLQLGHSLPFFVRLNTEVRHSKPHTEHFHHTFWLVYAMVLSGVRRLFRVGCQSLENSGNRLCRSLYPGQIKTPARYGQPFCRTVRFTTGAFHSKSNNMFIQTTLDKIYSFLLHILHIIPINRRYYNVDHKNNVDRKSNIDVIKKFRKAA